MPVKAKRGQRVANRNKAMAHKTRAAALNVLVSDGPAGPAEIARKIGSTTQSVAYHVRQLEKLECVELIDEEIVSGNVRHIFRAIESHMVDTKDWDAVPPEMKAPLAAEFAQGQVDDLVLGLRHGMGQNEFFHVTRDHYSVDQEGLEALMKIKEEARLKEQEVVGAAAKRIAEEGAEPKRVASALSLFEIPATS